MKCNGTLTMVAAALIAGCSADQERDTEPTQSLRVVRLADAQPGRRVLLPDGRLLRGPECKVPVAMPGQEDEEVTPERIEAWAWSGWVDLRETNLALWRERFVRIAAEMEGIPPQDTSSRFLRDRQFWGPEGLIQPGKVVGWIFATEEQGARMK